MEQLQREIDEIREVVLTSYPKSSVEINLSGQTEINIPGNTQRQGSDLITLYGSKNAFSEVMYNHNLDVTYVFFILKSVFCV